MIRITLFAVALAACGKSSETKPADPPPVDRVQDPTDKPKPADPPADKPADKPVVHDASCEALRDKYLAWTAERVEGALRGMPDHKKELQAEADKEAATAREKFVGACVEMGAALDGTCFDKQTTLRGDPAKHERCSKIVHQLEAKMFGH
jgi:hypothetical protein